MSHTDIEKELALAEVRAKQGKYAVSMWTIASLVMTYFNDNAAFISWQTLVILFVGMWVVAGVFGLAAYGVTQLISNRLEKKADAQGLAYDEVFSGNPRSLTQLRLVGELIHLVEAILIFILAYYVVDYMALI